MKLLNKTILIFISSLMISGAEEFRIWTSQKGPSVKAQAIKFDKDVAYLKTEKGKELKVKLEDLSQTDRQYLIDTLEADKDLLKEGKLAVPEKSWRKPKNFIKKLDETLMFDGTQYYFDLYETEHFLFAAEKGIKPHALAVTAEGCWHGMAFQHLDFRDSWGTTKKLIIIPEGPEGYLSVGKYEHKRLLDEGQNDEARRSKEMWPLVGVGKLGLKDDLMEKYKLKKRALAFHTKRKQDFKKAWKPFHTHIISNSLIREQLSGMPTGKGAFALVRGHSYYKEILLTRKTETHLIDKISSGDIDTKKGFKDGSAWPQILRQQVKKGKIKPRLLQTMLLTRPQDLDPESLVTMYSLSYFMQSSQKMLTSYIKLVEDVSGGGQMPSPQEWVKYFGYENVVDFEKAWKEFIISRNFK